MSYLKYKLVTENVVDGVAKPQELLFETLEQAKTFASQHNATFNVPVTIYDASGKVVEALAPVAK